MPNGLKLSDGEPERKSPKTTVPPPFAQAGDRLFKLHKCWAELRGLNAPTRSKVNVEPINALEALLVLAVRIAENKARQQREQAGKP